MAAPSTVIVLAVGPYPLPLHGMSHATEAIASSFDREGMIVRRFNTAPLFPNQPSFRFLWRALSRPLAYIHLLWFIVNNIVQRRQMRMYLVVSGGNGKYGEFLFAATARLFSLPIALHYHSFAYLDRRQFSCQLLLRAAGPRALHIVLCNGMEEKLRQAYSSVRNTLVVSNAALSDIEIVDPPLGRRLHAVGFLSNITIQKGIGQFIQLVRNVRSEGIDVVGHVAGPISDAESEQLIEAAVLDGTVRYFGPVSGKAKQEFLSSIDVFAFPTAYINEAEPFVVIEALASGVPIIASARGCIPNLVGAHDVLLDPAGISLQPAIARIKLWTETPNSLDDARSDAVKRAATLKTESADAIKALIEEVGEGTRGAHANRAIRKPSIFMLQTIVPDYRRDIFREVHDRHPDFVLIAGHEYFTPALRPVSGEKFMRPCKNIFLLKKRLLIQVFNYWPVLKADSVVVEFNPRVITNWLVLLARRLLGKPTVLWGHAWSRSGRNSKSEFVRRGMKRLASTILTYTQTEQREVCEDMPNKHVVSAPNAIYNASEMQYSGSTETRKSFLYVGRLIPAKKVDVLLRGYSAYRAQGGSAKLRVVGGGPELDRLKALANELAIVDGLYFEGHVSDQDQLRNWYRQAIATISPGYVGLSLLQSLSFGLPMIVSRDEPHAPEIEAAVEGFTVRFFDTGKPHDLATAMAEIEANLPELHQKAFNMVEFCRTRYSVEAMAEGIIAAGLKHVPSPRSTVGLKDVRENS